MNRGPSLAALPENDNVNIGQYYENVTNIVP